MDGDQPDIHRSKQLIYVAVVVLILLIGYVIVSALRRPGLVSPLAEDDGEGVRVIFVSPQSSEPPAVASPAAAETATPTPTATPTATPKTSPSATPVASPKASPEEE